MRREELLPMVDPFALARLLRKERDEARKLAEEWRDWGQANKDWEFCDWSPEPPPLPWEETEKGNNVKEIE